MSDNDDGSKTAAAAAAATTTTAAAAAAAVKVNEQAYFSAWLCAVYGVCVCECVRARVTAASCDSHARQNELADVVAVVVVAERATL